MNTQVAVKTTPILMGFLVLMLLLVLWGLLFPIAFRGAFTKPNLHLHAKFVHIISVTLVFANAVIGTLWETRSLLSRDPHIIRYTYKTVVWLDAIFTAPMILLSVVSGIILGTSLGGVWTIGWLSVAFVTYLFCGLVWVVVDIPSQYKINRLFLLVPLDARHLPPPLVRLLWFRVALNVFTLIPLLFIFYLMIHKPEKVPIYF